MAQTKRGIERAIAGLEHGDGFIVLERMVTSFEIKHTFDLSVIVPGHVCREVRAGWSVVEK